MIQNLFLNILEISIMMSVVILFVYAISPIFEKKYSARWKYYIWVLITIRLIIPITYSIPDAPIHINTEQMVQESSTLQSLLLSNNTLTDEMQNTKAIFSSEENKDRPTDTISLLQIGTTLWVIGIFVFSFYHIIGYFIFAKTIKRWSIKANPDENKMFTNIKESLGIKRNVILRRSTKIQTPMMLGIIQPTVCIPCIKYTETDLYLILKHELIHYKRHDIELKVLLFLVRTLYWFNPFVHLMSKKFDETIEMICDEYVISGNDSIYKKRYMETILHSIKQQSIKTSVFTSNYNGGIKTVKKRFQNILLSGNKKKGIAVLTVTLVCCLALSSLVAFGSNGNHTSLAAEQEKGETNVTKKATDDIVGVYAEAQPNKELEEKMIEYLQIPNDFLDETKYYYNYVDLNNDSKEEIFTVVMGPYTSGTGGSMALYMVQDDTGEWQVQQEFTLIQTPVIVSNKVTNGNKDLIVMNSGGGADGNYVVLTYKDGKYATVNEGTVIQGLEGITGKAIISNDIAEEMEQGKGLYLHNN